MTSDNDALLEEACDELERLFAVSPEFVRQVEPAASASDASASAVRAITTSDNDALLEEALAELERCFAVSPGFVRQVEPAAFAFDASTSTTTSECDALLEEARDELERFFAVSPGFVRQVEPAAFAFDASTSAVRATTTSECDALLEEACDELERFFAVSPGFVRQVEPATFAFDASTSAVRATTTSECDALLEEVYDELERFFRVSPESICRACVKLTEDDEKSATTNCENANRERFDTLPCNTNKTVKVQAYIRSSDTLQDPALNYDAHDTGSAVDGVLAYVQGTKVYGRFVPDPIEIELECSREFNAYTFPKEVPADIDLGFVARLKGTFVSNPIGSVTEYTCGTFKLNTLEVTASKLERIGGKFKKSETGVNDDRANIVTGLLTPDHIAIETVFPQDVTSAKGTFVPTHRKNGPCECRARGYWNNVVALNPTANLESYSDRRDDVLLRATEPSYENLDSHASIESERNVQSNSEAYAMGKPERTLPKKNIHVDQPSLAPLENTAAGTRSRTKRMHVDQPSIAPLEKAAAGTRSTTKKMHVDQPSYPAPLDKTTAQTRSRRNTNKHAYGALEMEPQMMTRSKRRLVSATYGRGVYYH